MGVAHPTVVTGPAELQMQLDDPSGETIRLRAAEVFGNEEKAAAWLQRPRRIFDSRSPQQIVDSADIDGMRTVLKALIAIEFGTFS